MTVGNTSDIPRRSDVGYKRPPVEHQFKPGNKPLPRRKRARKAPTIVELLIKILDEEKRVEIGGKVKWFTKARLLIMVAFQLAEKGNPILSRALVKLLAKGSSSSELNEPLIQFERPDGTVTTTTISGKRIDFDYRWNGTSYSLP